MNTRCFDYAILYGKWAGICVINELAMWRRRLYVVTIPPGDTRDTFFPSFGFMTTHDESMYAGQNLMGWLIWPFRLLILQNFISRYYLTINCISKYLH